MTYLDRHFIEGIRTEEHREIINGEAQFMADMAQILTEEAIKEGVSIDFGANKDRFEQTIKILGLEKFVVQNEMTIIESVVGLGGGSASFIARDRTTEAVEKHGVVTTLEALQAEAWKTEKLYGLYPYVTTEMIPIVAAKMVFGKTYTTEESEREVYLTPDSMVVAVANRVRYSPTATDEDDHETHLAYFVDSEERAFKGGSSQRLFQHLLQEREAGLDVQLPAQEFSISLSSNAHVVGNIFSARVAFDTPLRYEVKGDRVIASEPLL